MRKEHPSGRIPQAQKRTTDRGSASERQTHVAIVCGLLAGLPACCESTRRSIEDIRRRASLTHMEFNKINNRDEPVCYLGKRIASNTHEELLLGIVEQAEKWLEELAPVRELADLFSRHDTIDPDRIEVGADGEVSLE